MKRQNKLAVILATMVLLLSRVIPVAAANGPAAVSLVLAEYEGTTRQVTVSCKIKGGEEITNGKVRILYDPEKMELLSDGTGNILRGALCEINDCLVGNKAEGELVAAFASSGPLAGEGELLSLTFRIDETVRDGEELNVELKVEKLAGDDGEIEKEGHSLAFKAGEDRGQNSGGGQGGKADSSSAGPKEVKTGDTTVILPYLLMAGCAAAVIFVIVLLYRKKNVNNKE